MKLDLNKEPKTQSDYIDVGSWLFKKFFPKRELDAVSHETLHDLGKSFFGLSEYPISEELAFIARDLDLKL